ncbi:DUF2631 domain-containing protein, partial [Mycobacterium tuberculosis]|uniref:DUF2631 domain-containing protein n=1 Tax=Mycobacterium tuberculosis TaxID=1773 RepID=UPI003C6E3764
MRGCAPASFTTRCCNHGGKPAGQRSRSRIDHRTWHIVGLCIFGFLLAMLRGNHVGHVEDWFLITFAAVV